MSAISRLYWASFLVAFFVMVKLRVGRFAKVFGHQFIKKMKYLQKIACSLQRSLKKVSRGGKSAWLSTSLASTSSEKCQLLCSISSGVAFTRFKATDNQRGAQRPIKGYRARFLALIYFAYICSTNAQWSFKVPSFPSLGIIKRRRRTPIWAMPASLRPSPSFTHNETSGIQQSFL